MDKIKSVTLVFVLETRAIRKKKHCECSLSNLYLSFFKTISRRIDTAAFARTCNFCKFVYGAMEEKSGFRVSFLNFFTECKW